MKLESLLVSPKGFKLSTASPAQRAFCRAVDGLPLGDLWDNEDIKAAFGGTKPPEAPPQEIILLAAIRSGKSLMAAAAAIRNTQVCDVSRLGPGEIPRVSVLSLSKDLASVTFGHIMGNLEASHLRGLIMGEPTGDTVMLRHPSGRAVEIKVVAGSRAGASLVARWSAGVIFDEAPRMVGSDEGVVNLVDAREAVLGRILKGAQIIYIGSPWAPFGPIYEWTQEYFGKPDKGRVVVRASGPIMNPVYWTKDRCDKLKKNDPRVYRTDVLGEFADPESALFTSVEVEKVTRDTDDDVPYDAKNTYVAAMDPATRGNAWTLAVTTCTGLGGHKGLEPKYSCVAVRQWIGTKAEPLSPDKVLEEIAQELLKYNVTCAMTDQFSSDALTDIALRHGLTLIQHPITAKNKYELVENLRLHIADERFELPNDRDVFSDLISVRRRLSQDGIKIVFPKKGARHADYVPALALTLSEPPEIPENIAKETDPNVAQFLASVDDGQKDYWENMEKRFIRGS